MGGLTPPKQELIGTIPASLSVCQSDRFPVYPDRFVLFGHHYLPDACLHLKDSVAQNGRCVPGRPRSVTRPKELSATAHAEFVFCDQAIDITYIRMLKGWMHLVAILDWYSRYVISWELDHTLEMPFIITAVEQALSRATPVIWNSDQGSHFTSPQYIESLKAHQVQISMNSNGRVLDNIFTGRLWRTVKYEEVYLHEYSTSKEARSQLSTYFEFYAQKRLHQALNYRLLQKCMQRNKRSENDQAVNRKVRQFILNARRHMRKMRRKA